MLLSPEQTLDISPRMAAQLEWLPQLERSQVAQADLVRSVKTGRLALVNSHTNPSFIKVHRSIVNQDLQEKERLMTAVEIESTRGLVDGLTYLEALMVANQIVELRRLQVELMIKSGQWLEFLHTALEVVQRYHLVPAQQWQNSDEVAQTLVQELVTSLRPQQAETVQSQLVPMELVNTMLAWLLTEFNLKLDANDALEEVGVLLSERVAMCLLALTQMGPATLLQQFINSAEMATYLITGRNLRSETEILPVRRN